MELRETALDGGWLIDLARKGDSRGFFARLFCEQEFAAAGLEAGFVQINDSLSARAGTLRGLHYPLPSFTEVKVVRCIRGALWDRSEEHTSELQSLMRISYAVFCLKKTK